MTYDSVQGIKRLRKEIVERMQVIMKLAKERRTNGMHKFVEEIYHRVRSPTTLVTGGNYLLNCVLLLISAVFCSPSVTKP